jgi:hypothetical protein
MGYGFYWHPGQKPFLVTPDGDAIPLLVNKDIPYLAVGSHRPVVQKIRPPVSVIGVPAVEHLEVLPTTMMGRENSIAPLEKLHEDPMMPDVLDEHEPSVAERLKREAQSLNHKLHDLPKTYFAMLAPEEK